VARERIWLRPSDPAYFPRLCLSCRLSLPLRRSPKIPDKSRPRCGSLARSHISPALFSAAPRAAFYYCPAGTVNRNRTRIAIRASLDVKPSWRHFAEVVRSSNFGHRGCSSRHCWKGRRPASLHNFWRLGGSTEARITVPSVTSHQRRTRRHASSRGFPRPRGSGHSRARRRDHRGLCIGWFREWLSYNPIPTFEHLPGKVMVIFGALDQQVPASSNRLPVEAALASRRKGQFVVVTLPRLNHQMQTANLGSPNEYGQLTETVSPELLSRLTAWLTQEAILP
jgi:hypothetical protein